MCSLSVPTGKINWINKRNGEDEHVKQIATRRMEKKEGREEAR